MWAASAESSACRFWMGASAATTASVTALERTEAVIPSDDPPQATRIGSSVSGVLPREPEGR